MEKGREEMEKGRGREGGGFGFRGLSDTVSS